MEGGHYQSCQIIALRINNNIMLKNYFKTTLRSLKKNKVFSVINVFGLAIGLTASVFILQYAFFELSYDRFYEAHQDIYRVLNDRYEGEKLIQSGQITYSAVGKQMADDYPEVVRHTTINSFNQVNIRKGEKRIRVPNGYFVHPSFFEMFDYELLAGSPDNLVNEVMNIVLTASTARKLFDIEGEDFSAAVGQLIYLNKDTTPTKVTGVVTDPPVNSHLQFGVLFSRVTMTTANPSADFNWTGSDYYHYLQLVPGTDPEQLQAKFEAFSDKYFRGDEVTGTFEKFHLQALTDIYLYSDYEYEIVKLGNGKMIWTLIIVAAFILLMAWINYINLTNSRSLERAREVGVRKVVGATKNQLIVQYMTEAILVNLMAVILSFTLIQVFQNQFNGLVNEELSLLEMLRSDFNGVPVWLLMTVILLVGSCVSGIYPSLVMSNFKATTILKGKFKNTGKGVFMRKGLVVFQFSISTMLIAGTLLVYQQVNYMRSQELGMNLEQVMVINGPALTEFDSTFVQQVASFKSELKTIPGVIEVGNSYNIFGERLPRVFNATPEGSAQGYMLNRMNVGYGFMDTYGIDILAGRDFKPEDHNRDGSLVNHVIINEKASEMMGFVNPEDVVNSRISYWGRSFYIVGVTSDFHNRSLKKSIEPIVFMPFLSSSYDRYSIKLSSQNIKQSIAAIEDKYNEIYPGNIFEYQFMDDAFNQQYAADQKFGQVFNLFSFLAIMIACLGLFGLAGYNAIQRTKEIGVRKVLGANISHIVQLLSKDFMTLVILANAIALPMVYLGAQEWLSGYAYRAPIGLSLFVLPILIVLAIAMLTIIYHTVQSARRNPVESLRYE
jgi:putative ABC transport system permease protein